MRKKEYAHADGSESVRQRAARASSILATLPVGSKLDGYMQVTRRGVASMTIGELRAMRAGRRDSQQRAGDPDASRARKIAAAKARIARVKAAARARSW